MYSVLLVANWGDANAGLLQMLEEEGVAYSVVPSPEDLPDSQSGGGVDAVLLDLSVCQREAMPPVVAWCQQVGVPLLCGLPAEYVAEYDASWGASDFFLLPPAPGEVTARIRQVLGRDYKKAGNKVLQVGDLRIDQERYEVFNRGRRVLLTFKEYQLLCVLAGSPGRVFSRETLLNQIWEYDYFGGTRTVDVHIRRLRSKIENPGRTYIETVWNVGYRLRPQGLLPQGD